MIGNAAFCLRHCAESSECAVGVILVLRARAPYGQTREQTSRNLFWDHFPKMLGSRVDVSSGDWSGFLKYNYCILMHFIQMCFKILRLSSANNKLAQ